MNISARSQCSSAVEYRRVSCILPLRKATVIWPKFSFLFISICLSDAHLQAGRCSRQSQVSAALSPFHICLSNIIIMNFNILLRDSLTRRFILQPQDGLYSIAMVGICSQEQTDVEDESSTKRN